MMLMLLTIVIIVYELIGIAGPNRRFHISSAFVEINKKEVSSELQLEYYKMLFKKDKKYAIYFFINLVYFIYIISLLFTPYRWYGVLIYLLGKLSSYRMKKDIYNSMWIFVDALASLIILFYIFLRLVGVL